MARITVVATEATEQVVAWEQLQYLNQQLEVRVAERTKQLEAVLQRTEQRDL